jgi:HAD superfamily hydrolase (TIGR01549 family)
MGIKTLFFDLDNTLYDAEAIYAVGLKNAWLKFRESRPVEFAEFQARYDSARLAVKEVVKQSTSCHSRLLFLKRLIEDECGHPNPKLTLELDAAYSRAFGEIPKAPLRDFLAKWSSRYPLGLITNQICVTQLQKLSEIDPNGKFFKWLVTSEEAGCEKPDPRIFSIALARAGCSAENSVMVGDNWDDDIAGAAKAGMKTVYVNPQKPRVQLAHSAWITRLDDLEFALKELSV